MSSPLCSPSIFVRVRPKEAAANCEPDRVEQAKSSVEKQLDSWSTGSVSLRDRHGVTEYDFPRAVLPPQATQEEAYETIVSSSSLMDAFIHQGSNAVLFAYGQTGTGKTHTIFGTKASLEMSTNSCTTSNLQRDWGLLPRIVASTLSAMSEETKFTLEASAVEFYLGSCFDLLDKRNRLVMNQQFEPVGATPMSLTSMRDTLAFLHKARSNRTSRGTLLNPRKDEQHEGSSRSHCALILTLRRLLAPPKDQQENGLLYLENTFHLVDLAGAERPGKNGAKRASGSDVMTEMMTGKPLSTGSQAFVINFELASIASEVVAATTSHRVTKKYTPPLQMCPPAVSYLCARFNGNYAIGMIICLSQEPDFGWETWFSLQYGTNLSKLRTPKRRSKPIPFEAALRSAKIAAHDAKIALEKTPKHNAPSSKYYTPRYLTMLRLQARVDGMLKLKNARSENV